MNRTVVSGVAAFALMIGATLAMTATPAQAGGCGGGLLAKLHAKKSSCSLFSGGHGGLLKGGCGGGLIAKLKAKCAAKDSCCAPEPTCCEPAPEPTCCEPAPEPTCCEPAPEPTCCEAAPEPACGCEAAPEPACGCEAAPEPACGCEAAPVVEAAPCCGGGEVVLGAEAGYEDSAVATDDGFDLGPGEVLVPGSVVTATSGEAAPAAVEAASSSDAPPAPVADAKTDI